MSIAQVRPSEFADWCAAQAVPVQLLDVREAWELQVATVAQSSGLPPGVLMLHIPMSELPGRLNELNPDAPCAVLCHHGTRSQHVAQWLAQNNMTCLANVQGGTHAWSLELDATLAQY